MTAHRPNRLLVQDLREIRSGVAGGKAAGLALAQTAGFPVPAFVGVRYDGVAPHLSSLRGFNEAMRAASWLNSTQSVPPEIIEFQKTILESLPGLLALDGSSEETLLKL